MRKAKQNYKMKYIKLKTLASLIMKDILEK